MKKATILSMSVLLLAACSSGPTNPDLKINDQEYFEGTGVNVLVYSNTFNGGFNDEKNSGIELIHHGVRTAQGGAVRLNKTPEQWDLVPTTIDRRVDVENNKIEVDLRYEDYDFNSTLIVTGKGKAVEISVVLDKPLPAFLEGKAGFNLEFLPSQYWQKTYIMDGQLNRFSRYTAPETEVVPNSEKPKQFKGFKTYDDRGTDKFVDPKPLSTGHNIILASDTPERMVTVTSEDATLELYDGRVLAQNGWYVLRSVLPAGKTGKVITWTVKPNDIPGWIREPNIGFSQVGYVPNQPKVAVIELDKNDKVLASATLYKIEADGRSKKAYEGATKEWGRFYKYNYVHFDFSSVKEPGIYYIQYGETKTNNFIINDNVYDKITDATSDIWIPIHMNHMTVNEGYRIWHGEPFKEGYLQAPESDHFDLHFQGPIETKYKAYELIPGLNVGGFFDAGDYDIETGSNISVVQNLIRAWNLFRSDRDQTFVSEEQRYVDLHRPDGVPDILQFIEHCTLNLVKQSEMIGWMSSTLSNGVLDNYHHLGDISAITDGLHYDRNLKPYTKSADGKSSGINDDLWAFTTRNPMLDSRAANVFAAASKVLEEYDPQLSKRALTESKRLMKESEELMKKMRESRGQNGQGGFEHNMMALRGMGNMATYLELYNTTGEQSYLDQFKDMIFKSLEFNVTFTIQTALDAVPYLDEDYKNQLKPYVEKYKLQLDSLALENPYGVPIGLGNWAASGNISSWGTTVCYAHKYFPDVVPADCAYKAAGYLFGCHPYHNYSLVAAVGAARPKQVFYGNNRADFSFIPGNVAPGILFRHPDHFENYDDWPFLWGQNEGTIAGNVGYLIFGSAFKNIDK